MHRTILSAATLALLSACAAPAAGGGASLTDSHWRFTAVDGAAMAGDKATLSFSSGRISANVGCNGMSGPWRIESGRLIAGPLISTQMWCEGKMEQERAVSALLSSGPELTVTGDRMTLKSGAHAAELVRPASE